MWWMPWRLQAKKDVAACEKLRGAGKRALIRRYPNGETHPSLDGFPNELGSFVRAVYARTKAESQAKRVQRHGGWKGESCMEG